MSFESRTPMQTSQVGLRGWLEDRLEIDAIWRALFLRKVPFGVNWLYTLGFASLALLVIQAVTGVVLALYYAPTPDHAYDSVRYMMTQVPYGDVIRGIHHWGASAMVVVVVLHLLVVFAMSAYKYPREATWVVGVFLLLVTLGFGFTGYLLPWDEKAYWATTVGTNMAGTVPVIGGILVRVVRGGAELGALTLTRFYAAHVLLLPMTILALVTVHLFAVIRQGVSVPPGLWDRDLSSGKAKPTGAFEVGTSAGMKHESYHQRYERFKAMGRPFFPDLIFEDAVVAVLVALIVVGLAVFVGAPLESQADPTNTAYVPRPEWYFMFLFQMLKYFPGSMEWVGAIVVPGLFVLALLVLPFINRRAQRSPRYQPGLMAVASVAVLAVVLLTFRAFQTTPPSTAGNGGAPLSAAELAGQQLVRAQNCAGCHVINGHGGQVGPSLDGVGSRHNLDYIRSYVENPKSKNKAAKMPAFVPPLTRAQVEEIAKYLLTLK